MIAKTKLLPGAYLIEVRFLNGAAPRRFHVDHLGVGWFIREGGRQLGGASHSLQSAVDHIAHLTGQCSPDVRAGDGQTYRVYADTATQPDTITAESDYAAALKVARRLGFRGEPERSSMAMAGPQRFTFYGGRGAARGGGRVLELRVVEAS